ncbi:MAG: rRNA maturation RNase YbeY [Bdellovibrionales bacterium]|jgi:probable rRNA maturation factor
MAVSERLHLIIESKPWGEIKGLKKRLEQATALTLAVLPERLLPAASRAQLTLLLTTAHAVQVLNRDYRGVDKPTNVLSFPQLERRALLKEQAGQDPLYVGDIAVAYQVVLKEAKAEGKLPLDHLTHLLIHGILHLFGYDHDTPRRAQLMEKIEREVMATLGLLDPYAAMDDDD